MPLTRRHILTTLPVLGAATFGIGFSRILKGIQDGKFNPHAINTPWSGRNIPDFPPLPSLPVFGDKRDLETLCPNEFRHQEKPFLVNFMASWCIPCIMEMPFLHQLSQRLPLWGIVYKDNTERISSFLHHNGQPYTRLGNDIMGRCAIEWGISGVPESFLILPGGHIAWHGLSTLDETIFRQAIQPLLAEENTP